MESYTFVDRYFHSQNELVDFQERELRDINTLFSYLNNLHSISDKLKDQFSIKLAPYPEFKILRILRNYFHHVGDIDEIRMYLNIQPGVSPYHAEQVIIPMKIWAEAVNNFVVKNTLPETHKNYDSKQKFIKKEFNAILDICDCVDVLENPKLYCKPLKLNCDNRDIELGFDIFKFVYNISNIIADECKNNSKLSSKKVICQLTEDYTSANNIPKYDLQVMPGVNCILSTKGYIYSEVIKQAI